MNVAVSPDLPNCILWHPVSCLRVFPSIHLPGMVVSTWLCWREGSSGTGVGACPAAAVWSPSPLSPDSVVGLLYSSHNAVLVCVGEPLALISSKLQSSWTYNGDQRMGGKKNPATVSHWKAFTVELGHSTVGHGRTEAGKGYAMGSPRPTACCVQRGHSVTGSIGALSLQMSFMVRVGDYY